MKISNSVLLPFFKLALLNFSGAISSGKDSYRCSAFTLNDKGGTNYITQFTANANASKAHHIILQKCKTPVKQPGQIW